MICDFHCMPIAQLPILCRFRYRPITLYWSKIFRYFRRRFTFSVRSRDKGVAACRGVAGYDRSYQFLDRCRGENCIIPRGIIDSQEFPTPPSGGLIPPQLSHNTPRLQGEMRKRGEGEGGGKGKGEEKGMEGTPKGWLTPPMFQILKNTLQNVMLVCSLAEKLLFNSWLRATNLIL